MHDVRHRWAQPRSHFESLYNYNEECQDTTPRNGCSRKRCTHNQQLDLLRGSENAAANMMAQYPPSETNHFAHVLLATLCFQDWSSSVFNNVSKHSFQQLRSICCYQYQFRKFVFGISFQFVF